MQLEWSRLFVFFFDSNLMFISICIIVESGVGRSLLFMMIDD